MASDRKLRRRFIREMHLWSKGDPTKTFLAEDVCERAGIGEAEADVLAKQLTEFEYIELVEPQIGPGTGFRMTKKGFEEGEKLNQPLLTRFAEEYPFLCNTIVSSIISIATFVIGTWVVWQLGIKR